MTELTIINITKKDIDELEEKQMAEGGSLYYLRDLRGIDSYQEEE